jgi:hypothetical protein
MALTNNFMSAFQLQNLVFGKRTLAPDAATARRTGRRNLMLHAQTDAIRCSRSELLRGNKCPSCRRGNVQADRPFQKTVILCVNLVVTQVYEIETLRRRSFGHTESAKAPALVSECVGKCHSSAVAHLALLRYHVGPPSHCMQDLTGMPDTWSHAPLLRRHQLS